MKTLMIAIALAAFPCAALAQPYTLQTTGPYAAPPPLSAPRYNSGYSGNSQTYGNQTYYQDNRGNNCTTSRYGNQSSTTCY